MYTVVRRYGGASRLVDEMDRRQQEVRDLIGGVPGFVAYYAVRAEDGTLATITVCEDRAGTEESSRRAAAWVQKNVAGGAIDPPKITQGEAFVHFQAQPR